ncbi:MAG TPA: hypothetical protein ENG39_02470 [Candidatus Omnitrophica bacterium]|nr:hypothetical protein [Candidatus Omnitrophota bacterium]
MRRKFVFLVFLVFCWIVSALAVSVLAIEIAQVGKTVRPHPNTGEEFLILISDNFWSVPEIQEEIECYQNDVYQHRQIGSRVFMVSPAEVPLCNSDYEFSLEIRNFLKNQYYSNPLGARLVGTLLVGDIPWVMISERPEGPGGGKNNACYENVPADVYFAELSLEGWKIVTCPDDCPGYQMTVLALPDDCYSNLYQCLQPEIWVVRLRPIISFGWWQEFSLSERIEMLVRFFEKDHRYYEGELARENKDFINFNWMKGVFGCDYCNCDDPALFPLEGDDEFICYLDGITGEEFLNWWLAQPWRLIHTDSHGIMTDHDRGVGREELYNTLIATPIFLAEGCSTACLCGGYSDIEGAIFGPQSNVLVAAGCNSGCTGFPTPNLKFDYIAKAFWERTGGEQLLTLQIEGDPFLKAGREMDLPLTPTFISTSWEEYPYRFSSKYWEARPLVIVPNGDWVELKLGFTGFREPVDIYVGVYESATGNFYVWTEKGIILWDWNVASLVPYKKEWVNGFENILFSGNVNDLPNGYYDGYVMVVPAGMDMFSFSFENSVYYLWSWHWQK